MSNGSMDFHNSNRFRPDTVIANIAKQVETVTKGYVKFEVGEYDGPIVPKVGAYQKILISKESPSSDHINDQSEHVIINPSDMKYEFYLTTPNYKNYKFRILFFSYCLGKYPVNLIPEEGIALELFNEIENICIVQINSFEELNQSINSILNTKRIQYIIQSLISTSSKKPPLNEIVDVNNDAENKKTQLQHSIVSYRVQQGKRVMITNNMMRELIERGNRILLLVLRYTNGHLKSYNLRTFYEKYLLFKFSTRGIRSSKTILNPHTSMTIIERIGDLHFSTFEGFYKVKSSDLISQILDIKKLFRFHNSNSLDKHLYDSYKEYPIVLVIKQDSLKKRILDIINMYSILSKPEEEPSFTNGYTLAVVYSLLNDLAKK